MNPTDAEKLDGLKTADHTITKGAVEPFIRINDHRSGAFISFYPHDLVALCRAVVERVDGERTDKTYTDFMHEWIRRRNNGSNDQPEAAKESVWSWVKWAWEIAATTERHGKDGK